ncbi:MAG: family N-acetyltransferase [Micavibrio sp.]|nr:family N-acetyltransferase [Micavibrio sp.]
MPFTIRQLKPEDWVVFKAIRLKALLTDPSVFSSDYQKEKLITDTGWREWLEDRRNAVFGIFDGDRPVGMTGIMIDREDASGKGAKLWGSWLEPSIRGQGLSVMMYEARIDWARNHPVVEKVYVSHRESNLRSRNSNQKHGFVFKSRREQTWPDKTVEDEVYYELPVKPTP